ncbi:MAG: LPS export ABC transporter permease LptF [Pseudomonadota bacterium]
MGSLFSRYMFRQMLAALVLILVALTAVLWIALALKSLNVVTNQGQTTWTFIKITFLALPNLLTVIAPVALMIAAVQTLNRANGDSELIVMTASGATVWQIARPFLLMAVFVAIAVAYGNMVLNPWSARALQLQIAEVRTDLITQVMKPGEFSKPETGLTFHIRGRERDETIQGLMFRDTREKGLSMTYLAERAKIIKQDGSPFLVMFNGHIIRKETERPVPQVIGFKSYTFDIEQMAPRNGSVLVKPRSRTMAELINPDVNEPYFKRWPGRYRAELHDRISSILYPFVFVLVVLSQLGQAQTTRQGRIQQISIAVGFSVAVRLAGLGINNLVVKHAWATPLLYLLPIGIIIWAAYNTHRKMRPRQRSTAERAISEWTDRQTERFAAWRAHRLETARRKATQAARRAPAERPV